LNIWLWLVVLAVDTPLVMVVVHLVVAGLVVS
jgi:hypothetical protein